MLIRIRIMEDLLDPHPGGKKLRQKWEKKHEEKKLKPYI